MGSGFTQHPGVQRERELFGGLWLTVLFGARSSPQDIHSSSPGPGPSSPWLPHDLPQMQVCLLGTPNSLPPGSHLHCLAGSLRLPPPASPPQYVPVFPVHPSRPISLGQLSAEPPCLGSFPTRINSSGCPGHWVNTCAGSCPPATGLW